MNRLLALILLSTCLWACTTRSIQYNRPTPLRTENPSATIYLIKTALDGGWTKGKVYVDGHLIGRMGSSCYLKTQVPVDSAREIPIIATLGRDTDISLEVQAGKEYYFEYEVMTMSNYVKVFLRPLEAEAGKLVLSQVQKEPIMRELPKDN